MLCGCLLMSAALLLLPAAVAVLFCAAAVVFCCCALLSLRRLLVVARTTAPSKPELVGLLNCSIALKKAFKDPTSGMEVRVLLCFCT